MTNPKRSSRDASSSSHLKRLADLCERYHLSCGHLAISLGRRGSALAVVALSFPFLLPIPIPGLSILCGALICMLGLGIALDKRIKLPRWLATRAFPGKVLHKPLLVASRCLQRIEPFLQPRLEFVFASRALGVLIGITIIIGGLVVLLPLPPGTNFLSSLVSIIVALGMAARDGLVALAGVSLFITKLILYSYSFHLIIDWAGHFFA